MNRLWTLYKIGYFPLNSITLLLLVAMKSKNFQSINMMMSRLKFVEILAVPLVFGQLDSDGAKL